jgi:hypothetical protein
VNRRKRRFAMAVEARGRLIAKPYGDRGLGITVARLPGEYRVKYRNATDATARMAETLDQALWGRRPGRPARGALRRA